MKKVAALILVMACAVGLTGCNKEDAGLTLDKVIELSAKGDELMWSDFEQYESIDTGSGLYILVYDIDDNFSLWIGGGATTVPPYYIRLVSKADKDKYVDIRYEDVEAFIKSI